MEKSLKVKIRNFKGIKTFEGDLANKTLIGQNGERKTTILSAVMWVLTGYNLDLKFNDVKVQEGGKTENVETFAEVEINGVKFGRSYYENWVKDRETREKKFEGNKSDYFINDEKCSTKKEFDVFVDAYGFGGLKIYEALFSLMVPKYFADTLDEKNRMDIVFENIMQIEPAEICNKIDMPEMIEFYEGMKDVEKTRKKLVTEANDLDKLMESCETRIDERKLKKFDLIPIEVINKEKAEIQKKIDVLDVKINNDTSKLKKMELENQKTKLKNDYETRKMAHDKAEMERLDKLSATDRKKIADIKAKNDEALKDGKSRFDAYEKELKTYNQAVETITKKQDEIQSKRQEYLDTDKNVFNGFECPILKTHCETLKNNPDIEKLEETFNTEKADKLTKIKVNGHKLKNEIEELEKIKKPVEIDPIKLETVPEMPRYNSPAFAEKEPDFKKIEKEISEIKPDDKTKEIEEKAVLTAEIETVIKKYSEHDNKKENDERIVQIEAERSGHKKGYSVAQKKIAFIHKYGIMKAKLLEGDAKKVFGCDIKLFDFQVSGVPQTCCKFLDEKGVEFGTISNGEGIDFGIRLCDTLQGLYGFDLPILADNCEALTKEIKTERTLVKTRVIENKLLEVI